MLTYEAAIQYIYQFTDYEKKIGYRYAPETFDLSRIERLLALLDSPHRKLKVVHVAGSKGKGSTSAMIASVLQAAGYRVGLYTSPHLHTFRERIRINQQLIAHLEVAELIEELQPYADQVEGITTFEVITVLAFLYFFRKAVDIAVLEVGLGGRLDATNVVIPEVSVITSLSYDHTHLLGNTLAQIAREKAGIIKAGVPVVTSPQPAEAMQVIRAVCQDKNAPLTQVENEWSWSQTGFDWNGQSFRLCPRRQEDQTAQPATGSRLAAGNACLDVWLPLLGAHQILNAATAVTVLDLLRLRGWRIATPDILLGLRCVRWPGRLEILSQQPLIIVDSAHNADSAQKLVLALKEYFGGRPIVLIFGASSDKDIEGMLREFVPHVKRIIFTRAAHPRAANPAQLCALAAALGGQGDVTANVDEALDLALKVAAPADLICAAGSVFIAANLRENWAVRTGQELPEWDQ